MLASSRSVIACAPRPAQARNLASMFDAVGAAVRVEAVALSDQPGVTTRRVVGSDPGRNTIGANNVLGGADTLTRNRPAVRVEAEERFDVGDGPRPVEGFDAARHQNPANIGRPGGRLGDPPRLRQQLRLRPKRP
jgi:hypothetical protein